MNITSADKEQNIYCNILGLILLLPIDVEFENVAMKQFTGDRASTLKPLYI